VKKLFTSIRQGKLDEVARILDKNPDLIACLAKAPPQKDDGQSPLMVAIKSDNLEVAHLLLDRSADVNFRDAPTQPYNESAPICYFAVGQCFILASHTVGPGPEWSKGYSLLLRRLLDMGMDHNKKFTSDRWFCNAWVYALEQYEDFAHNSYSDYPPSCQREQQENCQLREMLKAVLDELLKHGADIHNYSCRENGLPITSYLIRNLEEGRELLDGFRGLAPDSDAFKPYRVRYRGKERVVYPTLTVEDYRQRYEIKMAGAGNHPPGLL